MRSTKFLAGLLVAVPFCLHCDRGIEPLDPSEVSRKPDLRRIFPQEVESEESGSAPGAAAANGNRRAGAGQGAAAAGQPARASEPPIRGRIEVADSLAADVPEGGVLFVIARTQPAGPPLAVLRVVDPRFPLSFEIGQATLMIPSLQFEGELRISARLDSDGNAMTKLAGDLVGGHPEGHQPGATGVVVVLDRRI